MADRAYVEFESSDLFLSHFYGAGGSPAFDPAVYEVASIRVPLEIEVPDHSAAAGSAYLGTTTINGERCFRFELTDGVDTHLADVRLGHMGCPVLTLSAL